MSHDDVELGAAIERILDCQRRHAATGEGELLAAEIRAEAIAAWSRLSEVLIGWAWAADRAAGRQSVEGEHRDRYVLWKSLSLAVRSVPGDAPALAFVGLDQGLAGELRDALSDLYRAEVRDLLRPAPRPKSQRSLHHTLQDLEVEAVDLVAFAGGRGETLEQARKAVAAALTVVGVDAIRKWQDKQVAEDPSRGMALLHCVLNGARAGGFDLGQAFARAREIVGPIVAPALAIDDYPADEAASVQAAWERDLWERYTSAGSYPANVDLAELASQYQEAKARAKAKSA